MDRHERDLAAIKAMRLLDDEFMSKFFDSSPECTEHVLRIILQREDIHVVSVKTQFSVHSLEGHSIRLDILAKDDNNVLFNVEIQRADEGAGQKRARYYSSLLDSMMLKKGQDYSDLPDTYVIFITEHDVMKKGKAVYHIERMMDGEDPFADGSHIVYVNGAYRGDTPIGQLMHDFSCTNTDDMKDPLLQSRTRYFKETEEGASKMSKIMEQMMREKEQTNWIRDAKYIMDHFKCSAQEAIATLKIPHDYLETVLAALK